MPAVIQFEWAAEVLAARDRRAGGITAHPYGLYLVQVEYPEQFDLPKRYIRATFSQFFAGCDELTVLRFC